MLWSFDNFDNSFDNSLLFHILIIGLLLRTFFSLDIWKTCCVVSALACTCNWSIIICWMSMLFLYSWSGHSSDRCDSVHSDREGLLGFGERDCFFTVSSPFQPTQSVRLVLQQLAGLHWATAHHHQDPPHAHWRLRLFGTEHLPQHTLQKNHQPDCLLWVWSLTFDPGWCHQPSFVKCFSPVVLCLNTTSGKEYNKQKCG